MTLDDLIALCPDEQFAKAKHTHLTNIRGRLIQGKRAITANARRWVNGKWHPYHPVEIRSFSKDGLLSEDDVKVYCDCGFNVYWGQEYWLTKEDAADIRYSDGSRPDIRNPKGTIMLCHHILRLATLVKKKGL